MLFGLKPFEAFKLDADALKVEEDESRLPIKWLAAAQVALRLAESTARERKALIRIWVQSIKEDGEEGVWSALHVPGIEVNSVQTAVAALLHIATDARAARAVHMAYSLALHCRLTLLESGPADLRAQATFLQADLMREFGYREEAVCTFEEAREDAIRARATLLEEAIVRGLALAREIPDGTPMRPDHAVFWARQGLPQKLATPARTT